MTRTDVPIAPLARLARLQARMLKTGAEVYAQTQTTQIQGIATTRPSDPQEASHDLNTLQNEAFGMLC